MRRKKRTKIITETNRVTVVRPYGSGIRAWCDGCSGLVQMITVDQAAVVAHVTARTIYRWVEAEKLHFADMPDGRLLICLDSLLK